MARWVMQWATIFEVMGLNLDPSPLGNCNLMSIFMDIKNKQCLLYLFIWSIT